jgi:DNA-binding Lrp family transcriptional regulator
MSKTTAEPVGMIENQASHRQIGGLRDALDERLVELLRRNARLTLTALAHELSLSRTAVQARMARLERDKVILGYRAVVAEHEDETLQAVLTLTFTQRPCLPIVRTFRHWPEIREYYSVTGPNDAVLIVRVADAHALSALVDRLSGVAGVASVQSAVVLRTELD